MSFSSFIKRFIGGIVLCVVAIWCFNEVRMPFTGNVPWSSGNTIWVIILAIVGVLALIWAYNLFISSIRMTTQTNRPPLPGSQDKTSLQKQDVIRLLSLQQAVLNNQQSFEAWTKLGYEQYKQGLNDDALASANEALELLSENKVLENEVTKKAYAFAWMVRGAALSTMDGKEGDALAACEEALALEPDNVDALYYKGRVLVFQERDNEAHEMFDRVIDLKPGYKDALLSKGALYLAPDILDDNHFNGALAMASELIRQNPNDAVGWRMQGTAYQFRGEQRGVEPEERLNLLSNALASFNMALEIDPTDSNTYLLKAGPYAVLGDYGNALDALNQGLKIDPTNTRLQEAKADILGKRTKATASKIGGTAGRMALGGGLGLVKGAGNVGKMFWDVFKDDMRKP